MSRIFTVLVIVSVVLLVVAATLGLRVGNYNEMYHSLMQAEARLREQQGVASDDQISLQTQEIEQIYTALEGPQRRARLHMLIGILASLVAILVNSISVTYFIGTSRWCKEVVETYELDPALVVESARLKRRSFPFATLGMLTVLLIVAFGAACDPGTLRQSTIKWVLPHFTAALGGVALIAFSYVMQAQYIRQNSEIVDRILDQVREIRVQRGLDVEA